MPFGNRRLPKGDEDPAMQFLAVPFIAIAIVIAFFVAVGLLMQNYI
jgi:hypothetical protein